MKDFKTPNDGKKNSFSGDFFITGKRNNIYEMRQNMVESNEPKVGRERAKKIGQKYARSKSWVVPKSAIERENRGKKFKLAESKYPIIPAGELSAMLAELSSMDNTESEYASETEYEEFASEEFASDSEEFASDDF